MPEKACQKADEAIASDHFFGGIAHT